MIDLPVLIWSAVPTLEALGRTLMYVGRGTHIVFTSSPCLTLPPVNQFNQCLPNQVTTTVLVHNNGKTSASPQPRACLLHPAHQPRRPALQCSPRRCRALSQSWGSLGPIPLPPPRKPLRAMPFPSTPPSPPSSLLCLCPSLRQDRWDAEPLLLALIVISIFYCYCNMFCYMWLEI